ncbi:MAG: hypothetical protein OEY89_16475 [Gammaproteobacteria bacterium]|nr:hypothetical protein [Gammaproteobacteria bacterium]
MIVSNLDSFEPDIDMPIDAGIRNYVLILRSEGIETFESCEGGAGHVFAEPTVRFFGSQSEGYLAFSIAVKHGLPVISLRRYYSVSDNQLEGPWWEICFRTTGSSD